MAFEFLLALFIMAVGLSVAGTGTYLYQGVRQEPAILRFDGKSIFGMLGHLAMSFVCGPFIMMKMGWQQQENGKVSLGLVLLGALVAFGWSFITGLLFIGSYFAVLG